MHPLLILLALLLPLSAQQRILTIGDSQSEEYAFEVIFSAPFAGDYSDHADNWIEILDQRRDSQLDFGSYADFPGEYGDFRNNGHKYNWAAPGFTSFEAESMVTGAFDSNWAIWALNTTSANKIEDQLKNNDSPIAHIVIFLGGNDINNEYPELARGILDSNSYLNTLIANFQSIITSLRSHNPNIPITIVNCPNVSISPRVREKYPLQSEADTITAITIDFNNRLQTLANINSTTAPTNIADIFSFSQQIAAPETFYIGTVEMIKAGNDQNPANHIFCTDGFHPNSGAQALYANQILTAINTIQTPQTPLLTNREIITEVLHLNPDQPYLDWATTFTSTALPMSGDFDNDNIPNLLEFALNSSPTTPNSSPLTQIAPLTFTFPKNPNASRHLDLTPETSTTLQPDSWTPIATSQNQITLDPAKAKNFLRLRASLKP